MAQTDPMAHIALPMNHLVMKAYLSPMAGLNDLSKASPGAYRKYLVTEFY